jgi:hypothetical protein
MCGHEEDGAGIPSNVISLELEPGQVLIVRGRVPGQRPVDLYRVHWGISDHGEATSEAYELTNFDGDGLFLINEWLIEV